MKIIIFPLISLILTLTPCLSLTTSIHILAKKCNQTKTVDLVILCGELHFHGSFKKNRQQFERFEKLFALNPEQTCVLVEDMHNTSFWFQNKYAKMLRHKYLQDFELFLTTGDEQESDYDMIDLVSLSTIPARTINIECRQWFQKNFEQIYTKNKIYEPLMFNSILKPALSLNYYIKKSENKILKEIFINVKKGVNEQINIFKNAINKCELDYETIKSKSFLNLKKLHLPKLKKYAQSFEDMGTPLSDMIQANALFKITNSHHYHTTFVFAGSAHHEDAQNSNGLLSMLEKIGYVLLAAKECKKIKECVSQLPHLAYIFMKKSDEELTQLMYRK